MRRVVGWLWADEGLPLVLFVELLALAAYRATWGRWP